MKLIIQIPCYNEAESLPETVAALPREVEGFDEVEWLIIDDGSADDTVAVARRLGIDHVVRLPRNLGLARAFSAGLEAGLARGADVIVNTDADNQYCAADIPLLVEPVRKGLADIVIGARPIDSIAHFSPIKKALQRLGSQVTRWLSGTEVEDAPSGFRAFSRDAARRLQVFSSYTYTLETIIQAGQNGMVVRSVPIRVNGPQRPSRLVKSIGSYVKRSMVTLVRFFMVYRPVTFFFTVGAVAGGLGLLGGLRFLYFYLNDGGAGHVQSLILSALLIGTGLLLAVLGLIADLISVNRRLLEKANWRIARLEETVQRQARAADEADALPKSEQE